MKKEILEKIDLLVEMSGSTNSYENLQEEYLSLTQDIEKKKNQLKNLKRSISSSKYMKANERIIDENIKIGLENRLEDLKESLEDLVIVIDSESLKEEEAHDKIISFDMDLDSLKRYIDSLNLKMKTASKKENTYQNYEELLDQAYQEKTDIEKKLKDAQSVYKEITKSLANLGNEREELEAKIEQDESKLKEISSMLANPSTYLDKKAQKRDEDLIDSYTKELENLEKRKLEILTDPSYIGHEAQELYLDDDGTSALEKIRELVTIVKSKPYMDSKENELDSLLTQAEQKRDEFASTIENKKYDGSDLSILQMRISYLEEEKTSLEEEMQRIKDVVSKIDTVEVPKLVSYVSEAKKERDSLKNDISEYKKVLEENKDMKSPKKRATMQAALKKKQEELCLLERILENFESDLEAKIIESKELEEKDDISKKLEVLDEEIASIKKDMALNSRGKDILALEKDKEELKNYNDLVSDILHRKKYSSTADEIYKEIESNFGKKIEVEEEKEKKDDDVDLDAYKIDFTSGEEEPSVEEKSVVLDSENESLTSLDDIFTPVEEKEEESKIPEVEVSSVEEITPVLEESKQGQEKEEKLVDLPFIDGIEFDAVEPEKTEEVKKDEETLDEIFPAVDLIDEVPNFPPRVSAPVVEEDIEKSNRHKVVDVEDLSVNDEKQEEPKVEELKDDDVMVSDFEDTDYISFNDLLEGELNGNKN